MNSHKQDERFNRAALLLGNEIAYAHDLIGNMTFLNRVGEQISAYTCEEVRRMNITELMAPEISKNSTLRALPRGATRAPARLSSGQIASTEAESRPAPPSRKPVTNSSKRSKWGVTAVGIT